METITNEDGSPMTFEAALACRRLLGNPEYKWRLVCRDNQFDDGVWHGHSFWRDQLTGLVSICDMSGERPHATDDGVLWVDRNRPWVVSDNDHVTIPVLVERRGNEPSRCMTTWIDGITIARKLGCELKVQEDSKLAAVMKLLQQPT